MRYRVCAVVVAMFGCNGGQAPAPRSVNVDETPVASRGVDSAERPMSSTGERLSRYVSRASRVQMVPSERHPTAGGPVRHAVIDSGLRQTVLVQLKPGNAIKKSKTFWIYRDSASEQNHGHWTNWMPPESAKMLKLNMADKVNPAFGESCIRVDIKFLAPNWCGVAVSSAADYWGEKAGAAFELQNAQKVIFFAKGARGGEQIQAKFAITGDKPFGDSDKIGAATKWLSLTKRWTKFTLDVSKVNKRRVVTPFVFVTNKPRNGGRGSLTFWIDHIHVEMKGATK